MAEGARKYRYADPVYGSVAYNYGATAIPIPRKEEPGPGRTEAPPRTPPTELEQERARERVRERERERERARAGEQTQARPHTFNIPVLGILGGLAVAVLAVLVLLSYVELTRLSTEQARLQQELDQLNEQGNKLMIAYESTFNMSEIEHYAVNVLGMTKLTDEDTTLFRVNTADRAEILNEDDAEPGFFDRVADFFTSLAEYFR